MRRLLSACCVALVALALTLTFSASPARAGEPSIEAQFVDSINELRASLGLNPVSADAQLTSVARAWSDSMAVNGLAHNPNMPQQVPRPWARVGENVGYGESVRSVMAAMVHSPTHYRVLSNPTFDSVGVGVTVMPDGLFYVTQDFRAPAQSAPAATPVDAPAEPAAVPAAAAAPEPTAVAVAPAPEPERPTVHVAAVLTALEPVNNG